MTNRMIRKLTPADMAGYMEIYLNAYPAGKDLSEECYDKYAARHTQSMEEFDHVTYYGLFEGDQMAAAMIDRLVHHGHLILFEGNSYRMEHALMKQTARQPQKEDNGDVR